MPLGLVPEAITPLPGAPGRMTVCGSRSRLVGGALVDGAGVRLVGGALVDGAAGPAGAGAAPRPRSTHPGGMVQGEHLSLGGGQGAQRRGEHQPVDRRARVRRRWCQPHQQAQPPSGPAQSLPGQVDRHPPHPGLGQVVAADPRPAGHRPGERLLHDVLRFGKVTGDGVQLPDQPCVGRRVERVEVVGVLHPKALSTEKAASPS
jgi:hypothetical protein